MPFDYNLDFKNIYCRKHPELYRVGRGKQGVLLVEPYKVKFYLTGVLKRPKLRDNLKRKFISYI